jgi:hypothetical protein
MVFGFLQLAHFGSLGFKHGLQAGLSVSGMQTLTTHPFFLGPKRVFFNFWHLPHVLSCFIFLILSPVFFF